MSLDDLRNAGVTLRSYRPGDHKTQCPRCSQTRRNKLDACLSVTIDEQGAVVNCHHCGWVEAFNDGSVAEYRRREKPAPIRPAFRPKPNLTPSGFEFFTKRGISQAVVERNHISLAKVWMPGPNAEVPVVAFPYLRGGEVVNVKYRSRDKQFRQEKGAEKILFGIDNVPADADSLIWVEGEMDVLALNEAGFWNVVSVPDGAPKQVKNGPVDPEDDAKFDYVWNCREFIDRFPKHILAVDADGPGKALEEELARRIGKDRCWRVTWPEDINGNPLKDANECLLAHGQVHTQRAVASARPYPIQSLFHAGQFEGEVVTLFKEGRARGLSTGFANIDPLMTIRPGELSVVTGYPSSGKSEFVDALAVNMAIMHGWKFAVCSFENPPDEHIAKWSEKYLAKPFYDGPTPRMTEAELHMAMRWVDRHFFLVRADQEAPTIDWVLEKATAAVRRYGINGLILDPYNEFEHKRPGGMSETEYVSQMLGKVKRFAQAHDVHVWFVAHPQKPPKDFQDEPPTLYDIAGSAHWVNKADLGVSVHRPFIDGTRSPVAEVHVKKVRFRACGAPGIAKLEFLPATGRYMEVG